MDNWQEILEAYARGPEILSQAIDEIPEEFLDQSLDENNWSIREIIHHIVEGDDIFVPFIKQALGGLGGHFQMGWYFEQSQIDWGKCWGFETRRIETALALYRANRAHTCEVLDGVEKPWEYKLSITWPDHEPLEYNIPEIMNIQIDHLEEHLNEIQDILQLNKSKQ
jgi:uncharacterized damage-inducible protein DinB